MNSAAAQQQSSTYEQIEICQSHIHDYQHEIEVLEANRDIANAEMELFADERNKYELLSNITDGLEKLNEAGGNALFWDGIIDAEKVEFELSRLRGQATFFQRKMKTSTDKIAEITAEIEKKKNKIEFILEDILLLRLQEEESNNEYIVEREIKPLPYRVAVMPWTKKGKDEKRFRQILIITLAVTILLGWLLPLIEFPIPDRVKVVEIPERLAKLIKKQKPKPKKKKKVAEQQKPNKDKKKPTKEDRDKARKKVQSKGVLAFKNNLANLLDEMPEANLGAKASLSNKGSTSKRTRRSLITAQANTSSGGINTANLSRNVNGAGEDLSAVAFSRIQSDIGTALEDDRPLSDGPGPSRTDEEIQIVFDRYKAALYRIYNRELRSNPTLQGKVVLRITIEPDGSVSLCEVESTDLKSKKLLQKIVARVKRFNFGEKSGVPKTTILYPIDFLPAS